MNDETSKTEKKASTQQEQAEDKPTEQHMPPQKNRWQLYLSLLLALALGLWLFWSYSPMASQWTSNLINSFTNSNPATHTNPSLPSATLKHTVPTTIPVTVPAVQKVTAPTFKPLTEEKTSARAEEHVNHQPPTTELSRLLLSIQQLQQQVHTLDQRIQTLQHQQTQPLQMHVHSQLFTTLLQASSNNISLSQQIIAWKSISFLPLLHDDKYELAKRAYTTLQGLQTTMQNTDQEMIAWVTMLTSQLSEEVVVPDMIPTPPSTDPYQQVNSSWFSWIEHAFVISKVQQHTQPEPNSPDAHTQHLIEQIQQLQHAIQADQWESINNLDTIFYQLGQHGITTDVSPESINTFKPIQQTWQNHAQTWMEQL